MSAGQGSRPGPEAEADTGHASGSPSTEGADGLSATNSEVESAVNHRRRRAVLRDACFSQEALDAFNTGDAYLRACRCTRVGVPYYPELVQGQLQRPAARACRVIARVLRGPFEAIQE